MPVNSYNPFSSDFLRGNADDRLRPSGTRSYVAGATDDPLKFMTIPQLLDRACARFSSHPAAIFADADCGCRGMTCGRDQTTLPPASSRWASAAATASASGRPIAPNGSTCSSVLRASAPSWSISILPIAPQSSNTRSTRSAAGRWCSPAATSRATMSTCCARSLPSSTTARERCGRRGFRTCDTSSCSAKGRCRGPPGRSPASSRLPAPATVAARGTVGGARSRRCDQHPVHQRHDRVAQRGDALPFQHRQQCALYRESNGAHRRRTGFAFRCRSTTASAWCSACCAVQPSAPPWCFPAKASTPRRRYPPSRATAARRSTACRRCSSPSSSIRISRATTCPRSAPASWRARRARSRRCARCAAHAYARGHHRLRHDGNEPDLVPVAHRRPARAAGRDRRPHPSARRSQDRGRGGRRRTARSLRRIVYPRLQRDEGLLGRSRTHGRGDRCLGLDAFRRSRDHRRAGLLQHRRPPQGHAHPRRRKHLPARGGGISDPPSAGSGRPGLRRARSAPRRGGLRLHRAQARPVGDGGRHTRSSVRDRSPTTRCRGTSAS